MAHTMTACRISMRRALAQRSAWSTTRTCPRGAATFFRALSSSAPVGEAAAAPAGAAKAEAAAAAAAAAGAAPASEAAAIPKSICPAGTVLKGINYTKGKPDPVALPDEEYPEWLWRCLEVKKTAKAAAESDEGDEFSKSKKQRRMAAKRQRDLETKMLATGNLEALAPKIPLQQQTVNLTGETVVDGLEATLAAAAKRNDLRVALRKERRAKIKESNYLRSM